CFYYSNFPSIYFYILPIRTHRTSTSTPFPYTTLFRSLVSGDLAQRRKPVNRRAMTYYSLLRLSFQNSILPPARVCGPCRGMLPRSEEHTSELQSRRDIVCRLLLEKKTFGQRFEHIFVG